MDLFDKDGNKIEGVVTKEEHEKQVNDAATLALANAQKEGKVVPKADLDKMTADIAKLKADLDKSTKDLEAASNKDQNFAELRKAKDAAEAKLKEFETGIGAKIADIEKQLPGNNVDESIKTLAEGDSEVAKKIKFHFDRISKPEDTVEEKRLKLIDATTLARGKAPTPNLISGVLGRSGGFSKEDMKDQEGTSTIKPELAGLAKSMGISDKDAARYGTKPLIH